MQACTEFYPLSHVVWFSVGTWLFELILPASRGPKNHKMQIGSVVETPAPDLPGLSLPVTYPHWNRLMLDRWLYNIEDLVPLGTLGSVLNVNSCSDCKFHRSLPMGWGSIQHRDWRI